MAPEDAAGDSPGTVLERCACESVFDKKPCDFYPEGTLQDAITEKVVQYHMWEDGGDLDADDQELVRFILAKAKKLFAIAIAIHFEFEKLRKVMALFKNNGICDEILNSHPQTTSTDPDAVHSNPWPDLLAALEPANIGRKKIWDSHRIKSFESKRWEFLAPVFSPTKMSYDLPSLCILPFISKGDASKNGSFGSVRKYEIHQNHIELGQPTSSFFFAVKEILPSSDHNEGRRDLTKNWEKEARALYDMNSRNHKHIVRFITAFRRGEDGKGDHYLMFEWADGGNLETLWDQNEMPVLNASLVKALVEQLNGLVDALSVIHKGYKKTGHYRHGDLKPANILWFKDGGLIGTLKISDWGIAKEHNINTELRAHATSARYGTVRYEPPEIVTGVDPTFLNQPRNRRSRLYDIWSLGCITLECIIWLLYGTHGLKLFTQRIKEGSSEPKFYQVSVKNNKKVARVHDEVISWMKNMAKDPACKVGETALGDLLEIVRDDMLVVKLSERKGSDLFDNETDGVQSNERRQAPPPEISAPSSSGRPSNPQLVLPLRGNDTPESSLPDPETLEKGQEPQQNIPTFTFSPPLDSVSVPDQRESRTRGGQSLPGRLRADEVLQKLGHILSDEKDEAYWLPPASRKDYSPETWALPNETGNYNQPGPQALTVPTREQVDYAYPNLDEVWEFIVDNEFASKINSTLRNSRTFEVLTHGVESLCAECQEFRESLWTPAFSVTYSTARLRMRAISGNCSLCSLFWRTCERHNATAYLSAKFDRTDSSIRLNSGTLPVLSIFRTPATNPGLRRRAENEIQIGFPELPHAGSAAHFEILRQWLHACDTKHRNSTCKQITSGTQTKPEQGNPEKRLPTRLIDVGREGDGTVRLWETRPKDNGKWIALSHQWGIGKHFCTTRKNIENHIKGIALDSLPATFRDAVITTRALGCRYLWIDSICIIQGKDGDFKNEARRMEDVYSGAYCVLAASRVNSHSSGFLRPRNERDYVELRDENGTSFYICETIDNFNNHVLEGALNQRGWVLQEHALARRTIFFTEHQTYWECGDGVRCETMTKMRNNLAAFIGDPNFPRIVMDASQGEKILRYQNFYRTYSRLAFTNWFDRPLGIDGLQSRLLRAMRARGGFGVLEDPKSKGLLRRSLLWRRGQDTSSLSRIKFPSEAAISAVPSWSWMAYMGSIDYLDVKFGGIVWCDIRSPWSRDLEGGHGVTEGRGLSLFLTAEARAYTVDPTLAGSESQVIFDSPGGSKQSETMCVVLGRERGRGDLGSMLHYLLIITQTASQQQEGYKVYERVGVGYLPGRCISQSGETVNIC